jgi:hypothetical protein
MKHVFFVTGYAGLDREHVYLVEKFLERNTRECIQIDLPTGSWDEAVKRTQFAIESHGGPKESIVLFSGIQFSELRKSLTCRYLDLSLLFSCLQEAEQDYTEVNAKKELDDMLLEAIGGFLKANMAQA